MTQASISDGRSRTVNYATNLMGEVVKRWETASGTGGGAPAEYWYRYAGKEMGKVGNDGTLYNSYISSITQRQTQAGQGAFEFGRTGGTPEADFGSRLEGISSYNQGSAAGTITARGGETLQAVAASLWGDSGLWYKLAQANGLSGDAALSAGQTLRIPAGVVRNTYNAATITPTDPADTLGDVNPTSPQAAPPKKQKCGMIGTILLVVIAIAVTIVTKGAAAKFATALVKAATGVAAGTALTGAAAVAATGIGYGLAAAAGSVVSQAVGVATGIQDKFNWKSVGMAFISGAVGGGMGDIGGKSIGAAMIRGAASSAISQGIGVALGLQDKFSWAAVAAAGVGAGIGQAVGETKFAQNLTAKSGLAGDIYVGMADAMGQAATLSLIQGTDFGDNLIASLPSVLGGAIGRQLGGAIKGAFDNKVKQSTQNASSSRSDWLEALKDSQTPAVVAALNELAQKSEAFAVQNVSYRSKEAFSAEEVVQLLTSGTAGLNATDVTEKIQSNILKFVDAAGAAASREQGDSVTNVALAKNAALLATYSSIGLTMPNFQWTMVGAFMAYQVRTQIIAVSNQTQIGAAVVGQLNGPAGLLARGTGRHIINTLINGQRSRPIWWCNTR
jgi:hypothetical protein